MIETSVHSLIIHGGRLDDAARQFPGAPLPWLDLSTGINPHAWGTGETPAPDLRALPSMDGLEGLCRAASRMFGAERVAIAALPGSEVGLRLLAHLGLPRPWRYVAPTYRTHAAALPGATSVRADVLPAEVERGGTLLLANPNNPDGRVCSPDELLASARRLAARGGMLVVDEAFADAVPEASILPLLTADDRVLVFRSFGKFFGLAGARLGFVCGAGDGVGAIAELLGSWPVSSTAIALGAAAYADQPWIAAMRVRLGETVSMLDGVLAAHRLAPRGACPLFRLVETGSAGRIFDHLGRAGILTRPFDYAPRWLRFGLPGTPDAFARLDEALRHL